MDAQTRADFGTLDRYGFSEQIVDRILQMIKEKRLKPGDALPSQRELAMMMGVSRPSIREALRALAVMNVIDIRHGSGMYVTALEPERLVERLEIVFALDHSTYLDLFAARRILEVGLAELAATRISDEELEELGNCLVRSRATVDDAHAFMEADLDLHNRILVATRSPILSLFMRVINRLSLYSRSLTGESAEVRRQSLADHEEIVRALRDRSPAEARNAMLQHLLNVERKLIAILGDSSGHEQP
jgi:GntR family transcriptional repressor for pyruvate dehydrogenase complex